MFNKIKENIIDKNFMRVVRNVDKSREMQNNGQLKQLFSKFIQIKQQNGHILDRVLKKNFMSVAPLNIAIKNNNDTMFFAMLNNGFNCSVQEKISHPGYPSYGTEITVSPIGLALYCDITHKDDGHFHYYKVFVNSLIRNNAKPVLIDLYYAVQCDDIKVAQYIIDNCWEELSEIKEVWADIADNDKRKAIFKANLLSVAAKNNDYEMVKLLLEKIYDHARFKESVKGKCSRAMYYAIENDNLEMVKLFLDNGADINFCGHQYYTPIFEAITYNRVNIAKHLIENGADIERLYGHGWFYSMGNTPLGRALDSGYYRMAKLLIENGATLVSTDSEKQEQLQEFLKKNNLSLKVSKGQESKTDIKKEQVETKVKAKDSSFER